MARDYAIEPDASNATYFMAAAAARPGASVTIPGLGRASLQGDVGFGEVLEKMGAAMTLDEDAVTVKGAEHLRGIEIDMSGMPDAAMTLAALAVLAQGVTTIRGLHTLRVKETDRLTALKTELRKLGATAAVNGNTLRIEPPHEVRPAEIDTYDDHRMAMAFAVVGTRVPGITIRGAECVSKTYPRFFEDLESLRRVGRCSRARSRYHAPKPKRGCTLLTYFERVAAFFGIGPLEYRISRSEARRVAMASALPALVLICDLILALLQIVKHIPLDYGSSSLRDADYGTSFWWHLFNLSNATQEVALPFAVALLFAFSIHPVSRGAGTLAVVISTLLLTVGVALGLISAIVPGLYGRFSRAPESDWYVHIWTQISLACGFLAIGYVFMAYRGLSHGTLARRSYGRRRRVRSA